MEPHDTLVPELYQSDASLAEQIDHYDDSPSRAGAEYHGTGSELF